MTDLVRTRMTAAQYFELPETNQPMMLLNGEVIEMPSPTFEHQTTVLRLGAWLLQRCSEIGGSAVIAPMDVYFDEANIPQPDVMWVAPNSQCVIEQKRLVGAPDLIIEVLSPSTALYDKRDKFRLYEKHGVREYWLVDPALKLIEVWQLVDGKFMLLDVYGAGETFTSPLLGAVAVGAVLA